MTDEQYADILILIGVRELTIAQLGWILRVLDQPSHDWDKMIEWLEELPSRQVRFA